MRRALAVGLQRLGRHVASGTMAPGNAAAAAEAAITSQRSSISSAYTVVRGFAAQPAAAAASAASSGKITQVRKKNNDVFVVLQRCQYRHLSRSIHHFSIVV